MLKNKLKRKIKNTLKNGGGFTPTPKFGVSLQSKRGFTLVELLVVIAIIGLLSGVVVINITNTKAKSRDAQRVSEMDNFAAALNLYHNDNNRYPIYDGYITGSDAMSIALKSAGYMSGVPADPLNQDSSGCGATLNGYRYYYQSLDGSDFYLGYCLETNSVSGKSKGENYLVP